MEDIKSRWHHEWEQTDPVLREGEPGHERDSNRIKVGDGHKRWSELSFLTDDKGSSFTLPAYLGQTELRADLVPRPTGGTDGQALVKSGTDVVWGAASGKALFADVTSGPYNATGNGSTDDTAAVQSAIDSVSAAGGGVVWLPRGTFIVSKVVLKPGVSIGGVGSRAAILKAKTGVSGTDFGIIEMTTGIIDFVSLSGFGLDGSGNAGQWGIYLYADKGTGSAGGLSQSRFSHLNITNVDNGIWLRGGRTGAVEPHQFLDFDTVTIYRTATGGGDCLRSTGQVNQVTRRNCLFQSASAANTRTGRSLYFGRDPNELANASARHPQAHTGILDSIQGAAWLVDIESGQNLVFHTPYCEKALNAFRARSVAITDPTDVLVVGPRFASVATTTEVPTTGGTVVDVGDYVDFRIKGPGYFVGVIPTPYVIQNDSATGSAQAVCLSVEGFITAAASTTLFNVPAPVRYMSNTGTSSTVPMGAWKVVQLRGRGAGAAQLATINSLHAPGDSILFSIVTAAIDINNTGNIVLPAGGTLLSLSVGSTGKLTKLLHSDGTFKWRLEQFS